VIRNEDDVYMFMFRFNVGKDATGLDEMVVTQFDPHTTGCSKCQRELEDVFGEPCEE